MKGRIWVVILLFSVAACIFATAGAKADDPLPPTCSDQSQTCIELLPPEVTVVKTPLPPELGGPNGNDSSQDQSDPQVVTTPTLPEPGAVTTDSPATPPYDACRNQIGIQPSVPLGQIRTDEGDCIDPPVSNAGLCQGDQFILTPISSVPVGLKAGQKLGPWVEGIGLVCWISDVVTYHANPADYFFSGYYVGDGGAKDGLFKCQTPYGDWQYYPYYTKKNQVFGQVFPSPGCA